jgi:hypothetical protein
MACPSLIKADSRRYTRPWDINAFDIMSYDEIDAQEFLAESEWNIIVKCGEMYYAFDRRDIIHFMEQNKRNIDELLDVCKTPFNQYIPVEYIPYFGLADYSVYEFRTGIVYAGVMLHDVPCYTVNEFETQIKPRALCRTMVSPGAFEIHVY